MTFVEHYAGYGWIKVKRFVDEACSPCEERYANLLSHHEKEANFLINEVRKLASLLDEAMEKIRQEGHHEPKI